VLNIRFVSRAQLPLTVQRYPFSFIRSAAAGIVLHPDFLEPIEIFDLVILIYENAEQDIALKHVTFNMVG